MNPYPFIVRHMVTVILVTMVVLIPDFAYGSSVTGGESTRLSTAKEMLELPWGIQPDGLPDAIPIGDLDENRMVYTVDMDVSPLLGTVRDSSNPRFIFTKDGGLIQVCINFDGKEYNRVEEHLRKLFGEPYPIIYEIMPGQGGFEERTEWRVEQTKITLIFRWQESSLVLSKGEFLGESPVGK